MLGQQALRVEITDILGIANITNIIDIIDIAIGITDIIIDITVIADQVL